MWREICITTAMNKTCSRCKTTKPFEAFCRCRKSKDGRQSQCKTCKNKHVCAYLKTAKGKAGRRKFATSEHRRQYKRAYYHRNKLSMNIARRIRASLRSSKEGRKWESVVGYSLAELMAHLETQFVQGMSWANYGSAWHIDHVRPIASFTITSMDCQDFRECWLLENLQPLLVPDNLKKSDTYVALV